MGCNRSRRALEDNAMNSLKAEQGQIEDRSLCSFVESGRRV